MTDIMDIHNIFRPGPIVPISLIDEYITLVPDKPTSPRLDFVVRKVEQVVINPITFSQVSGNSTAGPTEVDELYTDENELLQVRFIPSPYASNFTVSLYQPQPSPKGALKKVGTEIPFNITDFDSCLHLTQSFIYGTNTIYVVFHNYSSSAVTPSLQFFGFKYTLESVGRPPVSTKIPVYPLTVR
jgi:hypothetical protein